VLLTEHHMLKTYWGSTLRKHEIVQDVRETH